MATLPQQQNPTDWAAHQTFYSVGERAVINPFRVEYLKQILPAERKHIATTKILPALFDYWESINPDDPRISDVKQSATVCFIFGWRIESNNT